MPHKLPTPELPTSRQSIGRQSMVSPVFFVCLFVCFVYFVNLFAVLDGVVAGPVAGLGLAHRHHLLLTLLLKFHLEKHGF